MADQKVAQAGRGRRRSFHPAAPPTASIGINASSTVRHRPTKSKFSSDRPSGSIIAWQLAHVGFARCCAIRSRIDSSSSAGLGFSFRAGTSGGGSASSVPIRFSRIHLPRTTGDVRLGKEVTDRMLPWPSSPRAIVVVALHAAEMRAADIRNAVVPGEAFVHIRVVRGQQVEHASILPENASGKQLRFAPESLPQVFVEIGVFPGIGQHRREIAQEQPLPDEVARPARRREDRRASAAPAARATAGSCSFPELAASSSASSGMLLQRKNDRRDASSRSLMR